METAEVIIIGAGVVGASTAFSLARRGVTDVLVLERRQVASGATGKSSGLVRMHYTNPLETRLAFQAYQWFKHWDDIVGGHCGFVQTGLLRLVTPDLTEKLRANVRMQQDLGVNTRVVAREEIAEVQPGLWLDDVDLAAYEPEAGYADPPSVAYSLMTAARERGVRLRTGTAVTKITTQGGRVTGVETDQGPVAAPTVLIAANAWSRPLLQSVGQDLPISVERHEVAVAERPPALAGGHVTVLDGPLDTYFRVEGSNLTLIGTGSGEPADPDRYNEATTAAHIERVGERLSQRFPAMRDAGVRRSLAGIYDMTPDDLPVLDRVPGAEGLYCAVGFCGHGFKISPAVGAVMAELMTTGGTLAIDRHPVRFGRFAEGDYSLSPNDYLDRMTPQAAAGRGNTAADQQPIQAG